MAEEEEKEKQRPGVSAVRIEWRVYKNGGWHIHVSEDLDIDDPVLAGKVYERAKKAAHKMAKPSGGSDGLL